MKNEYSVVQEIVEKYYFKELEDGSAEVFMKIPKRFKNLMLSKLSELKTNDEEIAYYENN